MSEHTEDTHSSTDGLWRWLLGGLVGGGVILALVIAAYTIGYHRGQHHPRTAASTPATASSPTTSAATATTPPTTTTATATTTPSAGAPILPTPTLVARGKTLYSADGCSACHSLTGTAGVGPSFKSIAGSNVMLTTGQTVAADDAYLEQSIASPDAKIVKGYRAGIMAAAIASYNLAAKPNDIRALIAFIKAQK
jgi:cytochrome c oxidase subunit 2